MFSRLVVEIDPKTKEAFKKKCEKKGLAQKFVVENLIKAWLREK